MPACRGNGGPCSYQVTSLGCFGMKDLGVLALLGQLHLVIPSHRGIDVMGS